MQLALGDECRRVKPWADVNSESVQARFRNCYVMPSTTDRVTLHHPRIRGGSEDAARDVVAYD